VLDFHDGPVDVQFGPKYRSDQGPKWPYTPVSLHYNFRSYPVQDRAALGYLYLNLNWSLFTWEQCWDESLVRFVAVLSCRRPWV